MYFYGIDTTYIVLVLPAILFSLLAQMSVNRTFKKFSRQMLMRGFTGAQVAERMLRAFGITDIRVERVSGNLTDHFSPKEKVIRLSDSVYDSTSVAAAGVAAHECGHAMQYASGYGPIKLRNAIIPISQLGSSLSVPLILIGVLLNFESLITVGIFFFGAAVLFQLLTLPVEFNASGRATKTLVEAGIICDDEARPVKKVLSAAAMTYVAALAVSLAQFLRLLLLFGGGRRRD